VTVTGIASTQLDLVRSIQSRHYFWNGPPLLSTTTSADFTGVFGNAPGMSMNSTQLELLRDQIKTACDKGIKVSYWDQRIWRLLTAGLIKVVDVEAAAGFVDEC